jgi:hypothetical protein
MGLYPLVWWAVTSHATHLLLVAALCVLLVVYAAVERREFSSRMSAVGEVAALIVLAVAAQLGLHAYLYGKATLNGEPRPYLMARIIADGPGKMYLEKNCDHLQWAICGHLKELSRDTDLFLWDSGGVYEGSSDQEKALIAKEEIPLVLATLRTYPREQFLKSAANFRDQLIAFGAYGFDPCAYIVEQFDHVIPASRASYVKSRQARNSLGLGLDLVSEIQFWVILASLAVMGGMIPLLWKRHSRGLAGLGLIVVSMVVLNALVTGVLSVVDDRYGCRVIWLLPLMAGLMVLDWLEQRTRAREEGRKAREVVAVVV